MTGTERLRIGVAGLGVAFTLMLPTLRRHSRIAVVAAADPREAARRRFEAEFGGRAHASVEALCQDAEVDAVYVATPHQVHAEHAVAAARHGKHVLVEKPMALDLDSCRTMIAAARDAGVYLVVGPTHSFDAPIRRAREIVASGALGRVRMITAIDYTDFLYRLRRPEELETGLGGGVLFNQAPHQVDIVRYLGGGKVRTVRALTGDWDARRPTEGAYAALLSFEDGAFASIAYNGYGGFDSDAFQGWVDESGRPRTPGAHRSARQAFPSADEAEEKARRLYGGPGYAPPGEDAEGALNQHFGPVVVSCEGGDLRPTPRGIEVYDADGARFEPLAPPDVPRAAVFDELCEAVQHDAPVVHSGEWGMATLEVCLAMLRSAREGGDVSLAHQTGVVGDGLAPFATGRSGP